MVGAVLNFLVGCRHRKVTRPITPASRVGEAAEETYVSCLACGKRLRYNLRTMRVGKPITTADKFSGARKH
jgi:hypothetical protein